MKVGQSARRSGRRGFRNAMSCIHIAAAILGIMLLDSWLQWTTKPGSGVSPDFALSLNDLAITLVAMSLFLLIIGTVVLWIDSYAADYESETNRSEKSRKNSRDKGPFDATGEPAGGTERG